jgi:hypothetical protein
VIIKFQQRNLSSSENTKKIVLQEKDYSFMFVVCILSLFKDKLIKFLQTNENKFNLTSPTFGQNIETKVKEEKSKNSKKKYFTN